MLEIVIRQFHSSLPVLLPVVALLMHLPISGIPLYASANTMGPKALEDLFDSTPGPRASDLNAVNCMLRVLLPSLDINLSILRGGIRGGDAVRAKTVASFLLLLFYSSWKRLSRFRLLMFEPGLVEAFSKCVRTAWGKPDVIIENVPCGKEILQLVKAILYENIKRGSPPGSAVFNVVMQILSGGSRREQRNEDITSKDTEALDEFHCHVVDSLVDYCGSMKVEIQDEQQVVDERSTQHQEQHFSLICISSLDDVPQILDNFIGAASAAVALLFTDNDRSLRVYCSVLELCLSVFNSSLWSYLISPDTGEFRTSVTVMLLRFTTVSMLRRATIDVIGNGNSSKRDCDDSNSSKLHGGRYDDSLIQEEFEELPSSSSHAVLTDVDSLLKLLGIIHSNLDVLLPLDLPSDDKQEEEHLKTPLQGHSISNSVSPTPYISDPQRHHRWPERSQSNSPTSPRQNFPAISFIRQPMKRYSSSAATSKVGIPNYLSRGHTLCVIHFSF